MSGSKYQYLYNSAFSMGVNDSVAVRMRLFVHAKASVCIDVIVRLLCI